MKSNYTIYCKRDEIAKFECDDSPMFYDHLRLDLRNFVHKTFVELYVFDMVIYSREDEEIEYVKIFFRRQILDEEVLIYFEANDKIDFCKIDDINEYFLSKGWDA